MAGFANATNKWWQVCTQQFGAATRWVVVVRSEDNRRPLIFGGRSADENQHCHKGEWKDELSIGFHLDKIMMIGLAACSC